MSLLEKATKPNQHPPSTGIIYSLQGQGKTHLLASSSEVFEKVLIVTTDGYDETLQKFPKVWVLDLMKEEGDLVSNIKKLNGELRASDPSRFEFIGFDSVSKALHIARQSVVTKAATSTSSRKYPHDPDVPEQRDYQKATAQIWREAFSLRQICIRKGWHLWVTAWERNTEEDNDVPDRYFIDANPELRRLLAHEFSFVYRLTSEFRKTKNGHEITRQLHTFGSNFDSKSRVDMPLVIENPNAIDILREYGVDSSREEEIQIPTLTA